MESYLLIFFGGEFSLFKEDCIDNSDLADIVERNGMAYGFNVVAGYCLTVLRYGLQFACQDASKDLYMLQMPAGYAVSGFGQFGQCEYGRHMRPSELHYFILNKGFEVVVISFHLGLKPPQTQVCINPCTYLFNLKRLGRIVYCPHGKGFDFICSFIKASEKDYWDILESLI